MEIIFSKTQQHTFRDVQENQFFVDEDGFLCQKHNDSSYVTIADKNGELFSSVSTTIRPNKSIQRMLPLVSKIQF